VNDFELRLIDGIFLSGFFLGGSVLVHFCLLTRGLVLILKTPSNQNGIFLFGLLVESFFFWDLGYLT